MKECDILGVKTYFDFSYIFSGKGVRPSVCLYVCTYVGYVRRYVYTLCLKKSMWLRLRR